MRSILVLLSLACASSCSAKRAPLVDASVGAPAIAARLCTGGPRDTSALPARVQSLRFEADEFAAVLGEPGRRTTNDAPFGIVTSYPACPRPPDDVARARVTTAVDAFFASRRMSPHREARGRELFAVGCEEGGKLLVSISLGLALGEVFEATYVVAPARAEPLVENFAIAHADLDGDGKRDLVFARGRGDVFVRRTMRVTARFSATGRVVETPVEWHYNVDEFPHVYATAPPLANGAAIVFTERHLDGTRRITKRHRWTGARLGSADRLEPEFEKRYEAAVARVAELGQLSTDLDRCAGADAGPIDSACEAAMSTAARTLESEPLVHGYVGVRPCDSR